MLVSELGGLRHRSVSGGAVSVKLVMVSGIEEEGRLRAVMEVGSGGIFMCGEGEDGRCCATAGDGQGKWSRWDLGGCRCDGWWGGELVSFSSNCSASSHGSSLDTKVS